VQNDLELAYNYMSAFCGCSEFPVHLLRRSYIDHIDNRFTVRYIAETNTRMAIYESVKYEIDKY